MLYAILGILIVLIVGFLIFHFTFKKPDSTDETPAMADLEAGTDYSLDLSGKLGTYANLFSGVNAAMMTNQDGQCKRTIKSRCKLLGWGTASYYDCMRTAKAVFACL